MRLKKGDTAIIIFISGLILFLFIFNNIENKKKLHSNPNIVITANDRKYIFQFSQKERKIKVEGRLGPAVILIGSNWVQMLDSTCPNKLCVKQGKIYNSSKQIICLPNKISINIENKNNITREVDAICR